MTIRNVLFVNLLLLLILVFTQDSGWYLTILTIAQLIFVPSILHLLRPDLNKEFSRILPYFALFASFAVFLLYFFENPFLISIMATIYLLFTIYLAFGGIKRFISRGFVHFEEFLIDMGLIFLAVGGVWYFAYEVNLYLGFSPMITWLTSIHFHYSAFMLPVFLGLVGRIVKINRKFIIAGTIILIAPWLVALGITFSVLLEVISVILYIVGIYISIYISARAPISNKIQLILISISFGSLGISILFSLLYAYGNFSGLYSITIDRMIETHGLINVILFAFVGLLGWSIRVPKSRFTEPRFPVSKIRGGFVIDEQILNKKTGTISHNGLIDNMEKYSTMNCNRLSHSIRDFYENTNDYMLFAEVIWCKWFLPFAATYKLFSRLMKQINLPLRSKKVEMTGSIVDVEDSIDGRESVRAWIRKINEETVFVALYSEHVRSGTRYMNISLPLPSTSMNGILALYQNGQALRITSKRKSKDSDAGIYLAIGKNSMKLPLEEQFDVKQVGNNELKASHQMWVFSLPFLRIEYDIKKRELE